ncbi:hypothetical protein pb186bvf_003616 [Paramecium bursaria]
MKHLNDLNVMQQFRELSKIIEFDINLLLQIECDSRNISFLCDMIQIHFFLQIFFSVILENHQKYESNNSFLRRSYIIQSYIRWLETTFRSQILTFKRIGKIRFLQASVKENVFKIHQNKSSSYDSNCGYPEINMSRMSSVPQKDYFNLNGDVVLEEKEQSPQPPPQLQTRQSSKVKAREQFSNIINKKKIQKKPQIQNKQIKPQPEEPKRQEVFKKKVKKQVQLLPCNCTNSNCVKRYCRCFHSGQKCVEDCQCQNCKNNDEYAEDRNKAIYHVKTKCHRDKRIPQENLFKLTFIACSCKKSNCQKNYCECFLRGNKCGITCECENCENGQEEAYRQQQELKSKGGKKR